MVERKKTLYSEFFKRVLDLLFSFCFLIVTFPIMIIIALLIKLTSRGKIFFRQKRVGKNQKVFVIIKFRTMKTETAFNVFNPVIENNNDALTCVGRALRRLKLDELPQLFNVLKGDMSFVGPRPFVEDYLPLYEEWEKAKFAVRPGLAGWSQVHGNGYLPLQSRSYYDVEYTKKIHIWTDIAILFRSFLVILFGEKRFIKQVSEQQLNKYRRRTGSNDVLFISRTRAAEKKGKD